MRPLTVDELPRRELPAAEDVAQLGPLDAGLLLGRQQRQVRDRVPALLGVGGAAGNRAERAEERLVGGGVVAEVLERDAGERVDLAAPAVDVPEQRGGVARGRDELLRQVRCRGEVVLQRGQARVHLVPCVSELLAEPCALGGEEDARRTALLLHLVDEVPDADREPDHRLQLRGLAALVPVGEGCGHQEPDESRQGEQPDGEEPGAQPEPREDLHGGPSDVGRGRGTGGCRPHARGRPKGN